MTAFTTEKIDVEPWFDMELFMGVSQETRLGGDVMDRFMTLWKNWLPHLTVKGIDTGKIKYLLVALDESVEQMWTRRGKVRRPTRSCTTRWRRPCAWPPYTP